MPFKDPTCNRARESSRAACKKWREKNPEKMRAAHARWCSRNRDKLREYADKKRRRNGVPKRETDRQKMIEKRRCTAKRAYYKKSAAKQSLSRSLKIPFRLISDEIAAAKTVQMDVVRKIKSNV